ncbi:MAG: hypothetical protein CMM01_15550 [Rhodopirellula sp.]|nr:hypothetical protein [Rhodopirellula sp.]
MEQSPHLAVRNERIYGNGSLRQHDHAGASDCEKTSSQVEFAGWEKLNRQADPDRPLRRSAFETRETN